MREQGFGGSFQGFIEAFQRRYNYDASGLQLAQMVTDTFPSFRDEHWFEERRSLYYRTISPPFYTQLLTCILRMTSHAPTKQSSSGSAPKS